MCAPGIPTAELKKLFLFSVPWGTIIVFLILFSGCSHIQLFDQWDTKDTAMLATSLGLTAIDYRMTSDLSKRKDESYYEKYNFILGEDPSRGRINTWFLGSMLTKTVIAGLLPKNKIAWLGLGREFWLTWNVGVSSDLIQNNFEIGLEINF